jgi:UDP-glucose 4-epimerase
MKKILITGAFGNVGTWLAIDLLNNGYDVLATGTKAQPELFGAIKGITSAALDITNLASTTAFIKEHQPAIIIHLASVNDTFIENYAQKALAVNTQGTRNLLQAVANSGYQLEHFLYFSTFHVYGRTLGTITEETPVAPVHDYASTHFFAEEYVRQFHRTNQIPYSIFRLSNSYGCPVSKNTTKWYLVLNDLAKMAWEKQEIVLKSNGQPQRDFIWKENVCQAVAGILAKGPQNTVFNLGSGITQRLIELAQEVQKAYQDKTGTLLPIQLNEADKSVHNNELQFNISKLQALLGNFTPKQEMALEATRIFELLS